MLKLPSLRLAGSAWAALLLAGFAWAALRGAPAPAAMDRCAPDKIASVVRSAGLVFVGPPWLAEYLLVGQAPDSVVGMSNPVRIGLRRSLASRIDPAVLDRPDMTVSNAYQVNAENLLRRGVVVVIQAPFADRLAATGLCTAPVGRIYATPAAIAQQTRLYAGLVGDPGRADRLLRYYQARMDALAADLSSLHAPPVPRVAIIGMSKYGQIFAEAGRHPASGFMAAAGGVNALKDVPTLGARLDAERLLKLDPDSIFLVQALAGETPSPDALRHTPLGALRAVREGRVYAMPPTWTALDSVVETPSYERWMAERLHPGLNGSARESLKDAYAADLGVELPDRWVDAALAASGS